MRVCSVSSRTYSVQLSRSAGKEVKALSAEMRRRVITELRGLESEPRPAGCRKLADSQNRWRARVGDYRIIYSVDDAEQTVDVITVRHRSDAYK